MVMALVPEPPFAIDTLVGDANSAKFGAPLTVRLSVVVCVRLPDVPVMVTVAGPVVAVALAVKVSLLVVVPGFGLNAAVTPDGKPEADMVTLAVNPLRRVIVTVLVPAAPCEIATLVGDAAREKLGEAFTVRLTVAVCVRLPDVPVMVTVAAPVAAVALAVSVNVLVVVAGLVLKAAVTPAGKPDAANVTPPLKPF
jgi:hypothetical protein